MGTNLFRHARETVAYKAGDLIFQKGDPADRMFVVQDGTVGVEADGETLGTLGTGEMFGEMALVEDRPRSAAARAATDCILVPIDEEHFQFLVQQTPNFALEVMKTMSERLRRTYEGKAANA